MEVERVQAAGSSRRRTSTLPGDERASRIGSSRGSDKGENMLVERDQRGEARYRSDGLGGMRVTRWIAREWVSNSKRRPSSRATIKVDVG
jgi:hypothetical protein